MSYHNIFYHATSHHATSDLIVLSWHHAMHWDPVWFDEMWHEHVTGYCGILEVVVGHHIIAEQVLRSHFMSCHVISYNTTIFLTYHNYIHDHTSNYKQNRCSLWWQPWLRQWMWLWHGYDMIWPPRYDIACGAALWHRFPFKSDGWP